MSDSLDEFGSRVRTTRLDKGMTQVKLAEASGLQESWISHFEVGRRKPSVRNLLRLADALNVSADYLLGRELNRSIFRDALSRIAKTRTLREGQELCRNIAREALDDLTA